jgi:hypothetical protein
VTFTAIPEGTEEWDVPLNAGILDVQSQAQNAAAIATAAESAANAAQTTANTAVTNAATAQTTANTALTNAATAQTTANNAQTTANAALPAAGGTISGNLTVSGTTTLTGLATLNGGDIINGNETINGQLTNVNTSADPGGQGAVGFFKSNATTTHALTAFQNASGTTQAAINAVSNNANFSAVEITGTETGHGTLKIAHQGYANGSDANAAAVSLDLQTTVGGSTGTAAQGLFITSTTDANPGGNAINVRYNSSDWFVVKGNPGTGKGTVGIGVATGHLPTGMLEIVQKDTTTPGFFMQALASGTDMMQFQDSGGTQRLKLTNAGNIVTNAISFYQSALQLGATSADVGGAGGAVISMKNATTNPTSNPTGGVIFYSSTGGVPSIRDANGNTFDLTTHTAAACPSDQNLISWSVDPATPVNSTVVPTGALQLVRVLVRKATTVTNIIVDVATAGVTLTASENFVGLYNSSGTLLSGSADQTTNFGTAGTYTIPLTTPQAVVAGTYYVGILTNGTTGPQMARGNGLSGGVSFANAGLTASTYRYATNGTGLTSLPASVTMGSNTQATVPFAVLIS